MQTTLPHPRFWISEGNFQAAASRFERLHLEQAVEPPWPLLDARSIGRSVQFFLCLTSWAFNSGQKLTLAIVAHGGLLWSAGIGGYLLNTGRLGKFIAKQRRAVRS